jgi:pyruvate, water dikinase
VVSADAYLASMAAGHVRDQLAATPGDDAVQLIHHAEEMQALVRKAGLRDDVRSALADAYRELGRRLGVDDPVVAVRSLATAEDAADTSFAGMNRTFTNVRDASEVAAAVVEA